MIDVVRGVRYGNWAFHAYCKHLLQETASDHFYGHFYDDSVLQLWACFYRAAWNADVV